jgi:hypothetical protein
MTSHFDRDAELRAFLTALYPDPLPAGLTFLVRGVPVDKSIAPRSEFYPTVDSIIGARAELDRWNADDRSIFFGAAPRNGRSGDDAGCGGLTCLWADLDAKDFVKHDGDAEMIEAGLLAIRARLTKFPLAPSAVVETGGGLQTYWLLTRSAWRPDTKSRAHEWQATTRQVVETLAGLVPVLKSDPARTNVGSLLRLPTFANPKYEHRPVSRVVRLEPAHRYELDAFKPYAVPKAAPAPAVKRAVLEPDEHPLIAAFKERDMYLGEAGDGEKHYVVCPWEQEHTRESKSAASQRSDVALWVRDRHDVGFKCLHSHGDSKSVRAVYQFFGLTPRADDVEIAVLPAEADTYTLPLPSAARVGLAHDYAKLYSTAYGTDYNYWYFAFLAFFGAAVSLRARSGVTRRPVRLYVVSIGEKASGKSQSRDTTNDFFVGLWPKIETPSAQHYLVRNLNSDQAIIAASMKAGQRPLVCMPDEFVSVLKKCAIQTSSLGQMLTELFEKEDTDAWTKDDKKGGAPMLEVYLSLVGGTTPSDFSAYFDQLTAYGGLYSRFWLVAAEKAPEYHRPRDVDLTARGHIQNRTRDAIRRVHGRPEWHVRFTEGAEQRLEAWVRKKGKAELQGEAAVRVPDHVRKMATLLCLTDSENGGETVTELEMDRALALGDWQLEVRRMFAIDPVETRGARWAMQVRRALRRLVGQNADAVVRERDLQRAVNAYRWGPGTFADIVASMARDGELEAVPLPAGVDGGRPGRGWRISAEGLAGEG